MHPTARILLYLISALALPGLNVFVLLALGLLPLLPPLWRHRVRLGNLLWRARWLLLLLLLAHAYQLPGEAMWQGMGAASPSREGLMAGLLQCARLWAMLVLLDWLVLAMPLERLLAGVHGLLRPLSPIGLDADRATARLGLTLYAMERRIGANVLHDLLRGRAPGHDLPREQYLLLAPCQPRDGMILLLAGVLLVALWFSA